MLVVEAGRGEGSRFALARLGVEAHLGGSRHQLPAELAGERQRLEAGGLERALRHAGDRAKPRDPAAGAQPPAAMVDPTAVRAGLASDKRRLAHRAADDLDPAPDGLDRTGRFVYGCGCAMSLHSAGSFLRGCDPRGREKARSSSAPGPSLVDRSAGPLGSPPTP